MKAMKAMLVAGALLLAASIGSSCTLFEERPDKTCKTVSDCFQAQGETCDTTAHTCVAGPDAQVTP